MTVELWNDRTGNLIDDFASEAAALAAVHEVIKRDGRTAVRFWALDRYDGGPMLRGKALIDRALAAVPA